MADKKPEKSREGVAAVLVNCGSTAEADSRRISAAIISENLAGGAKGVDAITGGARLPSSVGQCVADQYDDKKPSVSDRVSSWAGRLKESFESATTGISNAVSDLAIKPGQGPTSVNIYNNTVATTPEQKL